MCVCVFVSVWVRGMKAKALEPWARAGCVCVCPAGGSRPGLRCLPRWGTAGAEWEGGSGREEWAGAVSQPAAEPPDKRPLREETHC